MDTSETYIKMCDCPEIQEAHSWELGSFYYMPKDGECAIYSSECREFSRFATISNGKEFALDDPFIWLPTQSQLQKMVVEPLWQLNFKFIDWLCDTPYDGHIRHAHLCFTSMEQLWDAFYMHEEHGKVWSKGEWIDES